MAEELRDGIIYVTNESGEFSGIMHPRAFLAEFGAEGLRRIPRDCSAEVIEEFIAKYASTDELLKDVLKNGG